MRARHGDPLLEPHQFRQHQCARHHGNVLFPRRGDLRIVGRHRGRDDDDIGTGNIVGRVPRGDAGAQCSKAARHGRRREVRSADLITLRQQHFGDAAHPRAADPDKVDALDFVLHRDCASSMHASAKRGSDG